MTSSIDMSQYPLKREQEKYDWLYTGSYGAGPVERVMRWADRRLPRQLGNVIDIGCGRGKLIVKLDGRYEKYTGIDVAKNQIEKMKQQYPRHEFQFMNMCDMPFEDDTFDYGFCIDVLEHIPPEFAKLAVQEMQRVCKNLVVNISCRLAFHKDQTGRNLHLTVMPPKWWSDQFDPVFATHGTTETIGILVGENFLTVTDPYADYRRMSGVRVMPDESIILIRNNKKLEELFDSIFDRVSTNCRWFPRIDEKLAIGQLANKFVGQPCFIIGKGPSLDELDGRMFHKFPEAPILSVNEAVFKIDSLNLSNPRFLIQHDTSIRCEPDGSIPLLNRKNGHLYPSVEPRYIYSTFDLKIQIDLTAIIAMRIATRIFGCEHLYMYCFDAAVNQDINYAKIVGYTPRTLRQGLDGSRFLGHIKHIQNHADVPIHLMLPTSAEVISYIPLQWPGNLPEHRVLFPAEHPAYSSATIDSPLKTEPSLPASQPDHLDMSQQASYPDSDNETTD